MRTGQLTKINKAELISSFLAKEYPRTASFLHYGNDWQLLFAVILSAQATDKSVNEATSLLFARYPKLSDYREENLPGILACISHIGLGKTKARYLILSAKELLRNYGGKVPKDRTRLRSLPGVGYKTSGVVLAELYDFPYIPVDTHIHRVSLRLGLVKKGTSAEETEKALEKLFAKEHGIERHHRLILFGRNICPSQSPHCGDCPFSSFCLEYQRLSKRRHEILDK